MSQRCKPGLTANTTARWPGWRATGEQREHELPAAGQGRFCVDIENPSLGYASRYALGRDYHKVLRNRLKQLGERIRDACGEVNFRPFVDSAPIMERPLAAKAGIGWVGKHSLILNHEAGSWFFLSELLIDLPLPVDAPLAEQCGRGVACITTCPPAPSSSLVPLMPAAVSPI